MTSFEIAAELGLNARTVRWYFKKHGIEVTTKNKYPNPWLKGTKGLAKANSGSFSKGHQGGCQFSKGLIPWNRGMKGFLAGTIHWNWQGGITDDYHRERRKQYVEERIWREKVFRRDDFTCQECGQRGGKLSAHHIQGWKEHPSLRYELSNGVTLCVECHKQTNNYAGKSPGR